MADEVRHALDGKLGEVAGRSNEGKRIVHTIDPDFITGIGRVSAFGAKKYHMRNFLKAPGMSWGSVFDSLVGHLFAHWGGEDLDDESGQPHILMAAWNVMVLHQYWKNPVYHPGDDRPSKIEHAGIDWETWNKKFEALRTATVERLAKGATGLKEENDPWSPYSVNLMRERMGLPPIEIATSSPERMSGKSWDRDPPAPERGEDMSTHMDEFSMEASIDRAKREFERTGPGGNRAVILNRKDARNILNAAATWLAQANAAEAVKPFETTEVRSPSYLNDPIRAAAELQNKDTTK